MISNFFKNACGSTSQDKLALIALAKEKMDQKFGVQLKEEIIYVHPYCDSLIPGRDKYQVM
jgi:UDP-N-acetylenolpyruvoylglucosamine reductase